MADWSNNTKQIDIPPSRSNFKSILIACFLLMCMCALLSFSLSFFTPSISFFLFHSLSLSHSLFCLPFSTSLSLSLSLLFIFFLNDLSAQNIQCRPPWSKGNDNYPLYFQVMIVSLEFFSGSTSDLPLNEEELLQEKCRAVTFSN